MPPECTQHVRAVHWGTQGDAVKTARSITHGRAGHAKGTRTRHPRREAASPPRSSQHLCLSLADRSVKAHGVSSMESTRRLADLDQVAVGVADMGTDLDSVILRLGNATGDK